jgi:fluoroquinolone transport system permease protein
MKKYLALLSYELKNLSKDKMNMFMILFPFFILFISGFVIPKIVSLSGDPQVSVYVLVLTLIFSFVMGCFVGGVMLGFSLLDNKDERTFNSISVTPASIKGYVVFKSVYSTVFSFLGNLIIIFGLKLLARDAYNTEALGINMLDNINVVHVLVFSLVNSLITPAIALIIAAIAKNKVEGFVFVKSGGLILMLPMLMMLDAFRGVRQYILGIMPNFWTVKALYNIALGDNSQYNLPFFVYMVIGAVFSLLLAVLFYRLFNKKLQIQT